MRYSIYMAVDDYQSNENITNELIYEEKGRRILFEKLFWFFVFIGLIISAIYVLYDWNEEDGPLALLIIIFCAILCLIPITKSQRPIKIYNHGIYVSDGSFIYFDEIDKISINNFQRYEKFVRGNETIYLRIDKKNGKKYLQYLHFIDDFNETITILEEKLPHIEILYTNFDSPPDEI